MPRASSSSSSSSQQPGGSVHAMEYVNMVHMDARGRRKEIVALVDHYGLLYYCRKGDLKEVREVLNVKIPNFDVNTPLRNRDAKLKKIFYCLGEAASGGDLPTVRYLVSSRKAEITKKDTDGWTCFNRAVYGNHISVVKYFLQQGASADCYNEDGNSGLSWACYMGHREMVELLLHDGADINITSPDGNTPLMNAALGGQLEIVKLLVNRGANTLVVNSAGRTAADLGSTGPIREFLKSSPPALKKGGQKQHEHRISTQPGTIRANHPVTGFLEKNENESESEGEDIVIASRPNASSVRRRAPSSSSSSSSKPPPEDDHQDAVEDKEPGQAQAWDEEDEEGEDEEIRVEQDEDFHDGDVLDEEEEDDDDMDLVDVAKRRSSNSNASRSKQNNRRRSSRIRLSAGSSNIPTRSSRRGHDSRRSPRLRSSQNFVSLLDDDEEEDGQEDEEGGSEEDKEEEDDDEEEDVPRRRPSFRSSRSSRGSGESRKRKRLSEEYDEEDGREPASSSSSNNNHSKQGNGWQQVDRMYQHLYETAMQEKRGLEQQLHAIQEDLLRKEIAIAKLTADLAVLDSAKASEVALLHALLGEEKKRSEAVTQRLHVYQGDVDAIHTQLHSIDYCDIVLQKLQHSQDFVERRKMQLINLQIPKEDANKLCSICQIQVKNIAFVPCGHVSMCSHCIEGYVATKGKVCPICNKAFDEPIRVYA